MQRLLTGPLCLWPTSQVTLVPDQRLPGNLPDRLIDLYKKATDVALFYYVGHGQIDDEGQLCLGLVDSRRLETERRATTSLTFDAVRRALRASPASIKVIILDCCFAGQAVHGPRTLAGQEVDVPALTSGTGAYILAATGPYSTAWFESDQDTPIPHTYFTKQFAEIVERGIPGEPAGLTLDPIYRRLREDLPAAGKPAPTRSSRDNADTFLFARNAAPRPPEPAAPADTPPDGDPAHRYRLLDDAERAARAIDSPWRQALALTRIAKETSLDDPDRTRRLLDDAERAAGTLDDPREQATAWNVIAEAVGADDPDRARQFLNDAEKAARRMPHPNSSGRVLAGIAETLYAYDPDGAERISTSPNYPDYALGQLVSTAVAHDPDHAERLARKIPDTQSRISAQARIAAAVAAYDPARARRLIVDAERTARTIADPAASAWALRDVVVRMVGVNPDNSRRLFGEAKRIADSITDPQEQAAAWTAAAKAIAADDPAQARKLLDNAERKITKARPPDDRESYSQSCLSDIV